MHAIGAGYGAYIPPPLPHTRAVSLNTASQQPARHSVSKAKSTTALRSEARLSADYENAFHTLQDPRTSSTSDLSRRDLEAPQNNGVGMEVAALSDKLISAINHQQVLDDTLAQTRHELDAARKLIRELEAKTKDHEDKVAGGHLVRKESVDRMQDKFTTELAELRKEKSAAQQEKRGIENELETLTASLFDEANKMVASANKEKDVAEKNSQKLRDQLKDEEALIASQNEQLVELKLLMTDIQKEHRKDLDSPRVSLGPKSPGADQEDFNVTRLMEAMDLQPTSTNHGIVPSPATKFTHLLKPQFRTDIPAYDDFKNLVQSGEGSRSHNPSHAPSRAGSGSYGGLNVIGLGSMYGAAANSSSPNLSAQSTHSRTPSTSAHAIPGSFSPVADTKGVTPLKDTRFFKRVMLEDIEPTLRLDMSPTISWLSRRSILGALADSTLIVEPIPEPMTRVYGRYTPCSLCGDSRRDVQNPRTHAMRVREGEGATKWPICVLCLEKVRAVGDLVTYLRMIRDGVVKCGDHREEVEAWEELIQLRERLFWARMAGGVIPSFVPSAKNSPAPVQGEQPTASSSQEKAETPGFATPDQTPRTSQDGTEAEGHPQQANLELDDGVDEKLTTFDNAKNYAAKRVSSASGAHSTPPTTPPRDTSTGVFGKISIPKGFWESQVNTLH